MFSSNAVGPLMDCWDVPCCSRCMASMLRRCNGHSHVRLSAGTVRPLLLCLLMIVQNLVLLLHLLLPALLQVMRSGLLFNLQLWF